MEDQPVNTRKYTIWAILFFMALFFLFYLFTHSVVIISGNQSLENAELLIRKPGEVEAKPTSTGFHLFSTGDYILEANKGISSSQQSFHVSPFKINKINLEVIAQREAYKIASGADSCPFGDVEDMKKGIVFSYDSYDCRSFASVFKNTFSKRSEKKSILDPESNLNAGLASPFKSGLVGISKNSAEKAALLYMKNGKIEGFDISKYTNNTNFDNYRLSISGDKIYLLDISTSKLFVFDDPSSKPAEIKLNPGPEGDLSNNVAQLQVHGDKIYFLAAFGPINYTEELETGDIYVYNLDGSLEEKIKIDKQVNELVSFLVLSEDTLVSEYAGNAYIYKVDGDKIKLDKELFDISQIIAIDNSAYVLKNGRIYQYQDNGSQGLIFHSQNIQVASLQKVGSELLFNGHLTSGENPINLTYLATGTPVEGELRKENYLPYSPTPLVAWMDYLDDKITFAPNLSSLILGTGGKPSYSQAEYKQKSSEIIRELEADGFTRDKYKIAPYPY